MSSSTFSLGDLFLFTNTKSLMDLFTEVREKLSPEERKKVAKLLTAEDGVVRVEKKTFEEKMQAFSSSKISLPIADFEVIFQLTDARKQLRDAQHFWSSLGSSIDHDKFRTSFASKMNLTHIQTILNGNNLDRSAVVLYNYMLYKVSLLPASILLHVDPNLSDKYHKSNLKYCQERLRCYRNLAAIFNENPKNLLINSKKLKLSWFKTMKPVQILAVPDSSETGNFVDFNYLESCFFPSEPLSMSGGHS